jgi:hypothetical protein
MIASGSSITASVSSVLPRLNQLSGLKLVAQPVRINVPSKIAAIGVLISVCPFSYVTELDQSGAFENPCLCALDLLCVGDYLEGA